MRIKKREGRRGKGDCPTKGWAGSILEMRLPAITVGWLRAWAPVWQAELTFICN